MSEGRQFELVPLDCPTCGAAVAADGEDVVFYCTACRNGYRFDMESRLLVPLEVSFVALPDRPAERYLPFWLLPAQVRIHQRDAGGNVLQGLLGFFSDSGPGEIGPGEGTFAVPAFHTSLDATVALARRYTVELPALGEKLGERLTGGCYSTADAEKLAHFALIASEVEKPDLLRKLDYHIGFGEARLLGVPFVRHGNDWLDSRFGIAAP